MTGVRTRGENIRRYILKHVEKSNSDVTKLTAEKFGISRQAVNQHLRRLRSEGILHRSGKTRGILYQLAPISNWQKTYLIEPGMAEDTIWMRGVRDGLGELPDNVLSIWHYGFTEMCNNAIDHSDGSVIVVGIKKTALTTEMYISDNGVGIFKKIQNSLGLLDERHSILELSKGKLTTDPERHTGEGVFFTSRMFDLFDILSGGVYFSHSFSDANDWILERDHDSNGTLVWMNLSNHTARTPKKVFDKYTSGDDYGFTKTVVPVKLARYDENELISRSQAKRLLTRVELFKTVILDFKEVDVIGQAFADEIFRVFIRQHPEIEFVPIHVNSVIRRMIARTGWGTNS